jgi:hypothetical protein
VPAFRISGAVAATEHLQTELYAACLAGSGDGRLLPVVRKAENHASAIRRLCTDRDAAPADMPTPTRHAYQWLAFASDPTRLERMVATIRTIVTLHGTEPPPQSVVLVPGHVLYHARRDNGRLCLRVHIGFVDAPQRSLADLVAAAGGDTRRRAAAKRYSRESAYAAVMAEIEELLGPARHAAIGSHHDLELMFHRLNHRYFQGRLAQPRLRWSRRITVRKMGHYDVHRDTVVLSSTLDSAAVPLLVVEFVLFHELLHKQFGVAYVRGRCRAHTPAFRTAERRFVGYAEAKRLLDSLDPHSLNPQ